MDKGFNDDELEDIMNEIESLEQEFAADGVVDDAEPDMDEVARSVEAIAKEEAIVEEDLTEDEATAFAKVEPIEEVIDTIAEDEQSEESLLQEIASMPVDSVLPQDFSESLDEDLEHNIVPMNEEVNNVKDINDYSQAHDKATQSSMSFSVEGDMKLDLSFSIGGQVVQLHVSDSGFEIELEGGAKFSLPMKEATPGKKVA